MSAVSFGGACASVHRVYAEKPLEDRIIEACMKTSTEMHKDLLEMLKDKEDEIVQQAIDLAVKKQPKVKEIIQKMVDHMMTEIAAGRMGSKQGSPEDDLCAIFSKIKI